MVFGTLPFRVIYSKECCLIKGFNVPLLNILMTIVKHHILVLRCFGGDFSLRALMERINKHQTHWLNAYKQLPYLNHKRAQKLWLPVFYCVENLQS